MQAVETSYKGYRFRSRLEARYAVFFDALGVKWDYEAEGYDLDGLYYLPDFRVYNTWNTLAWGFQDYYIYLEIKGVNPNHTEIEKLVRLTKYTKQLAFLAVGLPDEFPNCPIVGLNIESSPNEWFTPLISPSPVHISFAIHKQSKRLALCPYRDKDGALQLFPGFSKALLDNAAKYPKSAFSFNDAKLVNAYSKARSARFEFRESG